MKPLVSFLVILGLVVWWGACGSDDEESEKLAEFEVVSATTGLTEYGRLLVNLTIESVGTGTAHSVSCTVYAKDGDTIVDTAIAYFAVGGEISPGEKAVSEVVFLQLGALGTLKLEYKFKWEED